MGVTIHLIEILLIFKVLIPQSQIPNLKYVRVP